MNTPMDYSADDALEACTPKFFDEFADPPIDDEPAAPPITFSPQQDMAAAAVRDWLTTKSAQVFRLFGYAGTGKTTLAKSLARTVGGQVFFAAFTGKAASVMRRKGCNGASTIHRLIYRPRDDDDAKISELRKHIIEEHDLALIMAMRRELDELLKPKFSMTGGTARRAALIVIDECSMVDERIGEDLLSLEVPVLVLGDPAQLPPVGNTGGFFTEAEPDVLLDQIHRQAEGSGILQLATMVRQRQTTRLVEGIYGDEQSAVLSRFAVDQFCDPLKFDQVLVGTHKTRRLWNQRIRQILGRKSTLPEPGDKLVCMRNIHSAEINNGELWTCREAKVLTNDQMTLTVESEDEPGRVREVTAVRHLFEGREDDLNVRPVQGGRFDFGYALTVHKAQGSQWNRVLLINEANAFRRSGATDTPWRWLYTAITRSSGRVVVAQ